jgi:hypothetical protein
MDKKLMATTFRNVIFAGAYIFGISQFLFYGEKFLEGANNSNLAPFAFLLLFSLSAAVVGSLVFGQAIMLFFENKRSESIQSVVYSILWLFLITLTVITALVII